MNLGLLTAIWGRPRLTELVLRYYEGFDLVRNCVLSHEDECSHNLTGWEALRYENDPLSNKWNVGISWMEANPIKRKKVSAVMIVGSDDLITPQYVEVVKYLLEKGADYIILPSLYFYDLDTGRMHYCLAERLGLGRVLSRRLLDMLDWKPWPDGLNKGLDGAMWDKIQQLKEVKIVKLDLPTCKNMGIAALDIKGGGENLWGYDHAVGSLLCSPVKDPAEMLNKHFPSVASELLNWNENEKINGKRS